MKTKRRAKSGTVTSSLIRKPIQRRFAIFLLPTFLCFCIGFLWPFLQGIFLSFHKFTTVSSAQWVGFSNYAKLAKDTVFHQAVGNSVLYMVLTLVFLIPFPMLWAHVSRLMLNRAFSLVHARSRRLPGRRR